MGPESFFTYGLKTFLIVLGVTTVIGVILWKSVDIKIETYNRKHPEHAVSGRFVAGTVRLAVVLYGTLIVMNQIKPLEAMVDMLLGAGGVFAVCIALAARESLSNYIAGYLLTFHKPFKIGDRVCLKEQDISGVVEDITFRHTVLRLDGGTKLTVPNAVMNSVPIEDLNKDAT